MTLLDPNAGAGPSGLPPMTLPQAADYVNRLAMIESRFLEVVQNDPVTWAASSTKAAIVLFGHCRDLEQQLANMATIMESGGYALRCILEDPDIGDAAKALIDTLFATDSDNNPGDNRVQPVDSHPPAPAGDPETDQNAPK